MNTDDASTCTVLLIDDEPFAQDIISHGLKGCAAHSLRFINRPGMAVEVAREIGATVVLVDAAVPDSAVFPAGAHHEHIAAATRVITLSPTELLICSDEG